MFPEHLFPKLTKKDKARHAKRRRKHCSKNFKWAVRLHKKGFNLVSGTYTKCLDCGMENYSTRLGCSCWTPDKTDAKGVVWGVHIVTEIGNGISKPYVNKSYFITFEELRKRIENNGIYYEIFDKKQILLNNI